MIDVIFIVSNSQAPDEPMEVGVTRFEEGDEDDGVQIENVPQSDGDSILRTSSRSEFIRLWLLS
jgi:hypothetical protein